VPETEQWRAVRLAWPRPGAPALAAACAGLGRSGPGPESASPRRSTTWPRCSRRWVRARDGQWDPPLRLVGAIAEGWAEESVSQSPTSAARTAQRPGTLSYLPAHPAGRGVPGGRTGRHQPGRYYTGCSWSNCRAVPTRGVAWPCPSWSAVTCGPPSPGGDGRSPWPSRGPAIALVPARSDPAAPLRQAAAKHPGRVRHPDPHDPVARAAHRGARLVDELAR